MNGFVKAFVQTLALIVGVLFLFFFQVTQESAWLIAGGFLVVVYFVMRLSNASPKPKAVQLEEARPE
jgi:hypothetical protein